MDATRNNFAPRSFCSSPIDKPSLESSVLGCLSLADKQIHLGAKVQNGPNVTLSDYDRNFLSTDACADAREIWQSGIMTSGRSTNNDSQVSRLSSYHAFKDIDSKVVRAHGNKSD